MANLGSTAALALFNGSNGSTGSTDVVRDIVGYYTTSPTGKAQVAHRWIE